MANQEHLKILEQGWNAWNQWRMTNSSSVTPDLSGADLSEAKFVNRLDAIARMLFSQHKFQGVNFNEANLSGAKLHTNLYGADFGKANLSEADLEGACLNYANFERANLSGANLSRSKLLQANLSEANLSGAVLIGADLEGTDLSQTVLNGADLTGANLSRTRLVRTNLEGANITNCSIYGLSAWDVNIEGAIQSNLVISPKDTPAITVDNLEVAQFIYLLLNNQKIRDVINTLGQKAVLILGRFSPERKEVLDAIADGLRQRGFLPIIFDFEKSQERDFTETIMVLAGLSLFVIADITNPKSSPLELHATVPNYMIPFVPIIQEGELPFSMFADLQRFDWVLNLCGYIPRSLLRKRSRIAFHTPQLAAAKLIVVVYDNLVNLLNNLDVVVINPALSKHNELIARKANKLKITHINLMCDSFKR